MHILRSFGCAIADPVAVGKGQHLTLEEYLQTVNAVHSTMNLVHCTTVGAGVAALEGGVLNPTPCGVYGADLLYLFYGRPAYKPAAGVGASGILDHAPICLVFDPAVLPVAVRTVPFDSGGYERYRALVGHGLDRADFELNGDASHAMRLVHAFYGSNRNYYDQVPTTREADIGVSRRSARALARLIADPAIRNVDDRCGTIELQFSEPVSLATALRAIVAPAAMLDDTDVRNALAACPDAVPLPYKMYGRFEPANFAGVIYERVETFLESNGVFA